MIGLLGKMEISDPTIFASEYFTQNFGSSGFDSLAALSIIQDLYVETTHTIWKVPSILAWLKKCTIEVCEMVENLSAKKRLPESIRVAIEIKDKVYGNFGSIPLELQRMIFVADLQSFLPRLPPIRSNIMSYGMIIGYLS